MSRGKGGAAGGLRGWVPRWWRGEGGLAGRALGHALWPAEVVYRAGVAIRNRGYDAGVLRAARASIPVVSIGNIGVGGAGKTPVAAWVAQRLQHWGRRPAVVLRGYGEDEVLVHRELNPDIPVIAAARRRHGVEEAAGRGCDAAVLDDGFQHRALARDLDVVLVAAESFSVAFRLLPRGPWREGLGALRRAGVVVVTRKSEGALEAARVAEQVERATGVAVARCHIAPGRLVPLEQPGSAGESLSALEGQDVVALTSLADPRPVVRHLEEVGARAELLAYPDHHAFTAADLKAVLRRAAGRPLVMTRKEAVKVRPLVESGVHALVLEQRVSFEAGEALLDRKLSEALRQ